MPLGEQTVYLTRMNEVGDITHTILREDIQIAVLSANTFVTCNNGREPKFDALLKAVRPILEKPTNAKPLVPAEQHLSELFKNAPEPIQGLPQGNNLGGMGMGGRGGVLPRPVGEHARQAVPPNRPRRRNQPRGKTLNANSPAYCRTRRILSTPNSMQPRARVLSESSTKCPERKSRKRPRHSWIRFRRKRAPRLNDPSRRGTKTRAPGAKCRLWWAASVGLSVSAATPQSLAIHRGKGQDMLFDDIVAKVRAGALTEIPGKYLRKKRGIAVEPKEIRDERRTARTRPELRAED